MEIDPNTEAKRGKALTRSGKIPKKLQVNVFNRLVEEFKVDPLKLSAMIARGEALTSDHPFLPVFIDALSDMKRKILTEKPIDVAEIDSLLKRGKELLTDSWVSHELRSKHVLDLMSYIYPKRKATEVNHSGSIDHNIELTPLNRDEIADFKSHFDSEY